ncbi:MAG TPA: tetratricopeptide repeat protein, partial [Acidobacteriota bacterium]|nr:tetratricopeptide repeat protein [Acidobacteriota bacterium]
LMHLALLLKETGRLDESRAEFERLYQRTAAKQATLGLAAVALQNLEQYQDANSAFRQAVEDNPRDVETWLAWGHLFLEKYDKANAASVFEDALKVSPDHPDALVGLATCLAEGNTQRVESLVQKALSINPNLVDAHVLLGWVAIESEQFEKAEARVEKALAVNPNSLEARSLKAVLLSARRKTTELDQEIQSLLQINPSYGKVYEDLADYSVSQRFYEQAVDYFRKAIKLNPRSWTAYSGLGINLLRLGDEEAAKEALEISYANDRFNVWTVNTLRLIDSFENFEILEFPRGAAAGVPERQGRNAGIDFRLRLHQKESEILRLYVPDLLKRALDTLSSRYAYRPKTPLYLEMYPDHEDFAVRTLGLPGLGALGVCFGPGMVMDSPSARPKGSFHWGSTLWHEFAHVITLGTTDHKVPRWFSEGLSVMEEHKASPGWGDSLSLEAIKAMQEKKLLPIAELNAGFQRPRFPGQVQLSYFQAGEACHFIEKEFGFQAILDMLQGFRQDQTLEEVFRNVLQITPAEFDARFTRYLENRHAAAIKAIDFNVMERAEKLNSEEELQRLVQSKPDSFLANLKLGEFYAKNNQPEKAVLHLRKAKDLFPGYVRPDNPYRQLAEIYAAQKNLPAAIAELEALCQVSATDFDALKQLGQWLKETGQNDRAIKVLEDALYVYPFDAEVHELLAEIAASRDNLELAHREYRAILALKPVDRAQAHFNLANVLFELGRKAEAKEQVLSALEIAPGYEPAQELLLKLSE